MHRLFQRLTLDEPAKRLTDRSVPWDYKYTLIARRHTGAAGSLKIVPNVCFICEKKCQGVSAIRAHILGEHKWANAEECQETPFQKRWDCSFGCDLKLSRHSTGIVKELQFSNKSDEKVVLGQVYLVNKTKATQIKFDATTLKSSEINTNRLLDELNSSTQNLLILQAQDQSTDFIEYFWLNPCCQPRPITMKPIPNFELCDDIRMLLQNNDKQELKKFKESLGRPTLSNYTRYMSKLNMVERMTNQLELDTYTQEDVQVRLCTIDGIKQEVVKVEFATAIKDSMPNLSVGDKVHFEPSEPSEPLQPTLESSGKIIEMKKMKLFIELIPDKPVDETESYTLTFELGVYTYDVETDSLHTVNQNGVIPYLFPSSASKTVTIAPRSFDWFSGDIESNDQQLQAVRHIVAGTAHPYPYLLFGPPGTGKTKTLVEAISQIYTTDASSRILVSATSNAAADEISERLLKNLPSQCWFEHTLYRLYSNSFSPELPLDEGLAQNSNFDLKFCPDQSHLRQFRIIITTLLVGGALRYAEGDSFGFTHLFIDECGSATEITSLVPIALCSSSGGNVAHIVLAGDPKQLGPVVAQTNDLGYGVSMLERLMDRSVYQKDPQTKQYNPNVLTQLVRNYRSHPAIIAPSNRFFYDGDLLACGSPAKTHCFVGWSHLPDPKTPIIFHASSTPSQTSGISKSIFNMAEVDIIVKYVTSVLDKPINGREFTESDIGIISPYRKQCAKIKETLDELDYRNIMVATVESFQGKEKPIILISTARSQGRGIGFLRNPKRLNVMLTRAQCLLVLVGDPATLKLDYLWRKLLNEFETNGVCTGDVHSVGITPLQTGMRKSWKPFKKHLKK